MRESRLGLGLAALLLAAAASMVGSVVAAPAALAHATLEKTAPKQGGTVTKPRSEVTLTFDEAVQSSFAKVVVTSPNGNRVDTGKPHIVNGTVTQGIKGLPAAGKYTVAWRVVSADGHPVDGQFRFVVAEGAVGSATPSQEAAGTPAASTPQAASVQQDTSFLGRHWLHIVGGLVVVAIGAAVVAWERRRRHG
ncbi:MAG: copper resistance CopC family protein [Streptosporangiales bacterium]